MGLFRTLRFVLSPAVGLMAMASVTHAEDAKPAPAPAYVIAPGPTLQQSLDLAKAAIAACQTRGFAASASVVDSAGLVKVTLRADGAPKPPIAAPLKAATAAAFDAPGSEMEPRTKTDADFAARMDAHKDIYNPHAGSLPLHKDGKVIGGLAVADVPHEAADACAREALANAAPELK